MLARGAEWAESAGEAARGADVVITMVGYPSDVEEAYLGADGIIASADSGTLLIDMTTSSPALAGRIASAASARELVALDAPVSGGDVGARNATLTIMVGGDEEAAERAMPVFSAMGKTILRHGGPGAGQHCKMANQIAIAASMLGLAECLAYAVAAGLDRTRVLETLAGGSAQSWTLVNYGPRVLAGDFQPGFYVKHFVKDLRIAIASAEGMRIDLPGLELGQAALRSARERRWKRAGHPGDLAALRQAAEREAAGVLGGVTARAAVGR